MRSFSFSCRFRRCKWWKTCLAFLFRRVFWWFFFSCWRWWFGTIWFKTRSKKRFWSSDVWNFCWISRRIGFLTCVKNWIEHINFSDVEFVRTKIVDRKKSFVLWWKNKSNWWKFWTWRRKKRCSSDSAWRKSEVRRSMSRLRWFWTRSKWTWSFGLVCSSWKSGQRFFSVWNHSLHWRRIRSKRRMWTETVLWRNRFFWGFLCWCLMWSPLKLKKCWICLMIFFRNVWSDIFRSVANSWSFRNTCIWMMKRGHDLIVLKSARGLKKKINVENESVRTWSKQKMIHEFWIIQRIVRELLWMFSGFFLLCFLSLIWLRRRWISRLLCSARDWCFIRSDSRCRICKKLTKTKISEKRRIECSFFPLCDSSFSAWCACRTKNCLFTRRIFFDTAFA